MIIENPTPKEFEQIVSTGKTLVDFWASWCGPCRMQAPIVAELADTTDVKLIKIDVDISEELTLDFQVNSIPTLILFEDGAVIKRMVGLTQLDEIKKAFGI